MNCLLIVAAFSLFSVISCANPFCYKFLNTSKCVCIEETLQIRCVDLESLDATTLHSVGNSVDTKINLLYILNTGIKEITDGSFPTDILRIWVEGNTKLDKINSNAFSGLQNTVELVIKNNQITDQGIFGVAKKAGNSKLKIIDFRKNKLASIPSDAFNNDNFAGVEFISLDEQDVAALTISPTAFGKLPQLIQLTIDGNVKTIGNNAIDLSKTKSKQVDVYIQNSILDFWDNTFLTVSPTGPPVNLVLKYNTILGDAVAYSQFENFFKNLTNKLFITTTKTECICADVIELYELNRNDTRVIGLSCTDGDAFLNRGCTK